MSSIRVKGRGSNTAMDLSAIKRLPGVDVQIINDGEVYICFDTQYNKLKCGEYFAKLIRTETSSWKVISHTLPHYLPIELILKNRDYENPEEIVEEIHQFLGCLASRKGQILEIQNEYPELLHISHTATYDFVRIAFKNEIQSDLMRGINFDLKYTLLGRRAAYADVRVPERTDETITREDVQEFKEILKCFKKYSIKRVIAAIVKDYNK